MVIHKYITPGQVCELQRMARAAAMRAVSRTLDVTPVDRDGFTRIVQRSETFRSAIEMVVADGVQRLSLCSEFADEEVPTDYGYLEGYALRDVSEQAGILRQLFPGMGTHETTLSRRPLPVGAEGYFVVPRWESIAPTYGEAFERALDLLSQQRGDTLRHWARPLGPEHLRLTDRTASSLQAVGKCQEGFDLLVLPAQFGLRHRGRSVRRASAVFVASEFGLGPFEATCMVLTHPERLKWGNELWIDCAGATAVSEVPLQFDSAIFIGLLAGSLMVDLAPLDRPRAATASASAFVP